jgi:hypothetical protein
MRREQRLAGAVVLLAAVASCSKAPPEPVRGPQAPLAPAFPARFRPPADGRITAAQVDRYVRVRRAARGRSEPEAARALGIDPDEYFWVRGRIVEAMVELQAERVRAAAEGTFARTLASLRESRNRAVEPGTARALDEQIAAMERERGAIRRADPVPPAVAANARLVASRRAEVESVSP